MQFIISYEVCGLFFHTVILVYYLIRRRLPNVQNRLFSVLLILGYFDIILDIFTAFTIENVQYISPQLNYLLNTIFYFIQSAIPVLLLVYVFSIIGLLKAENNFKISLLMIPFYIVFVSLILNLCYHQFFYIENGQYLYGKYFVAMYPVSFFYFIITGISINVYRREINSKQYFAIFTYLMISIMAIVIQYYNRQYLLTGAALSLSTVIMYLSLQNPEALVDPLTQCFNRESMISHIKELRRQSRHFECVLIAVDEMKSINTIFGMDFGNLIILEIVKRIGIHQKKAIAFRNIGDQFAVIDSKEKDFHKRFSEEIRQELSRPFEINGMSLRISVCICAIPSDDFAVTESDVVTMMEHTVALAKKRGKGSTVCLDHGAVSLIQREQEIENALRTSIAENSLKVYYQPIYSFRKQKFIGAEALVRMIHPSLGQVNPSEFVPIAEKNGMIATMGKQVLEKVCDFVSKNKLEQYEGFEYIDVNLSAMELLSENLCKDVFSIMDKYRITGRMLRFEVTESISMTSQKLLEDNMQKMYLRGISFALDDFGTGYSNLSSIIQLPFSTIKLDRSMMLASFKSKKSEVMFASTVDMVKKLGMDCVVEGVETAPEVERMKSLGVSSIQGFYYARPMPESEFLNFLDRDMQLSP